MVPIFSLFLYGFHLEKKKIYNIYDISYGLTLFFFLFYEILNSRLFIINYLLTKNRLEWFPHIYFKWLNIDQYERSFHKFFHTNLIIFFLPLNNMIRKKKTNRLPRSWTLYQSEGFIGLSNLWERRAVDAKIKVKIYIHLLSRLPGHWSPLASIGWVALAYRWLLLA